jgi:hypothetical protein
MLGRIQHILAAISGGFHAAGIEDNAAFRQHSLVVWPHRTQHSSLDERSRCITMTAVSAQAQVQLRHRADAASHRREVGH